MENLPTRVHPRVGAAAASNGNGRAQHFGQPRLQHILDGVAVRLGLPPLKVRSVVHDHGPTTVVRGQGASTDGSCIKRVVDNGPYKWRARRSRGGLHSLMCLGFII